MSTANPVTPLNIKQSPLLPMPAEKPSTEISSGYTETPDGLTTMGYTTQPESQPAYTRTVQYPNGNVVAFPDTLSEQEFASAAKNAWTQLSNSPAGRFVSGAYSTTLGALADVAHQYWTTTTTPAKQPGANFVNDLATSILNGHIDQAKKAATAWKDGRLVEAAGHAIAAAAPLVGPAAAQAGEAIGKGDVAGGLGQGAGLVAGALLGGKAAEGTEEAEAAAKPASLKTIAAPEPGLKAPAPMTEAERAAAAYTHRTFGPDQAEVQLLGHQVNETAPSEMQHGSGIERESGAGAPTEQEINDFIRQHYGDKAPTIKIVEEAESKPASSEDINQAAEAEAKKIIQQRPTFSYSKNAGELTNTHRVDVSSQAGANGYVTAIESVDDPSVWTLDKADVQPTSTGAGTQAYARLAKEAQRQGAELRSGSVVSKPAQRVWEKLRDQGFNVVEEQGQGGRRFRIPAPEKKPPQSVDITDDWKQAAQSESAGEPTGRNAKRAEPVQTVIPGTGVEEVKPEIPDTRPDVPTFYSKAERVAQEKIPNTASGDQILATLRNNGVKENEIGWMGLDDFLKGKPKVSKADLQQFINENQIQLGEVNRPANGNDSASLNTEKNTIHDYLDAVRGRNTDSPLGKALDAWLKDEGPESTSKLLSHPDVTPELASQITRYDQLDEQLKGAPERPAKYSKYVLDGPKENYNEKLLTLPQKDVPIPSTVASDALRKYQSQLVNKYGVNENSSTGVNLAKATAEESDRYYNLQQDARTEEAGNRRAQEAAGQYKNPHFEEPNVLAHVRHDDRIDTDGKKNLFLEEVQSDWHQAGKQEGYRAPVDTKELARQLDNANDAYQTLSKKMAANPEDAQAKADARAAFQETQRLERAYNAATAQRGVPEAPFKNDWHELVMKRMVREAAEKGYDRLSWTTGDQQADRYDLSHHIGRVQYDPDANELTAYDPHGHQVIEEKVDPDVDELARYIGKEPAQKLADQIEHYEPRPSDDSLWDMYSQDYRIKEIPNEGDEEGEPRYGVFNEGYGREPEETFDSERAAEDYIHDQVRFNVENYEHDGSELPEISGLDLKVGGEWAHALYDRAIPNFMNKHLKKWGGKVGTTYIPVGEGEKGGLNYHLIAPNGELYDAFRTRQQAEDALKSVSQPGSATRWQIQDHSPDDEAVHSIDITPQMRKSLMKEGQPISRNVAPPSWRDVALHELGSQAA